MRRSTTTDRLSSPWILRFSEDVRLNATAFGSGLLTITGGMLDNQRQLTEGSSIAWQIDVTPNDNADVIITLPANRACDPDAAPCTSDGRQLSAEASVTVTAQTPPVLTSARSLTAAENQTAVATLTATDDETPPADLSWEILRTVFGGPDQSHFTLSADGVLAFVFAQDFEYPEDANADGRYEVIVQIGDEDRQLSTPGLTVMLTNVNEDPTADAGADQTNVVPGTAVTLSGTGSDPDTDDTLSYEWTQTGEPMVELTDANTATATFTAPPAVTEATALTFTLRVTDAGGLFHEDTVTVTVRPQPPVITSAASLTVAENQTAVATLTATDADTPDADLTWSIPSGAAGGADRGKFTLSSTGVLAFASAQDFENPDDADTNGIYAVTVEVSDGSLTDTADLTVTLTNVNEAPTADAGADQTGVVPGTAVTLSGSGSDPDAGRHPELPLDADGRVDGDADGRQRGYGDLHRAERLDRTGHLDVHAPGDGRGRPVPRGHSDSDGASGGDTGAERGRHRRGRHHQHCGEGGGVRYLGRHGNGGRGHGHGAGGHDHVECDLGRRERNGDLVGERAGGCVLHHW